LIKFFKKISTHHERTQLDKVAQIYKKKN
jgi:hypothetical protein